MTGMTMMSLCIPANADITVLGQQIGSDVVFSYSGSVNLTGLTKDTLFGSANNVINPSTAVFAASSSPVGPMDKYLFTAITTIPFGLGGLKHATLRSGDDIGIASGGGVLVVPVGYVSGAPLTGSITFAGATMATLGAFDNGTYTSVITPNLSLIITLVSGPTASHFAPVRRTQPWQGERSNGLPLYTRLSIHPFVVR